MRSVPRRRSERGAPHPGGFRAGSLGSRGRLPPREPQASQPHAFRREQSTADLHGTAFYQWDYLPTVGLPFDFGYSLVTFGLDNGKRTVKVLPVPSSLVTVIEPPCC